MSHTTARTNMVNHVLRPNRISENTLLQSFQTIERESFTDSSTPYADHPTPELSSPLALAHLLQALDLQGTDSLLVLAGNTGYAAAIAQPLCAQVTLVEDNQDYLKKARNNLKHIEIIEHNPATYTVETPADKILIDTTIEALPATMLTNLKDGGKLATIAIHPETKLPTLTLFTRHGKTWLAEHLGETSGTPHPAFTQEQHFVF